MKQFILVFFFLFGYYWTIGGQSLTPDPSFGNMGKVIGNFSSELTSPTYITPLPAGKILMTAVIGTPNGSSGGGYHILARYMPDGTLDTTYGINGWVKDTTTIFISALPEVINQPDNKTILMANYAAGFDIRRYTSEGKLDTNFGSNGFFQTDSMVGLINPRALALQNDGKIIAVGVRWVENFDIVVFRLTQNGRLDSTFSNDGKVFVDFSTPTGLTLEDVTDLDIMPDGSIIIAGDLSLQDSFDVSYSTLVSLNSDGSLNTNFGNGGIVKVSNNGPYGNKHKLVRATPDNKIICIGNTGSGPKSIIVSRFISNGIIDSTFGTFGVADFEFSPDFVMITVDAIIKPDGKILIGCRYASNIAWTTSSVIQLDANGFWDTSFSPNNGLILIENFAMFRKFAFQPDGKLLVACSLSGINFPPFKAQISRFLADLNVGTIGNNTSSDNTILVYPNPVRQSTTFEYELERAQIIKIQLWDMQGKMVQTLLENTMKEVGKHRELLSLSEQLPAGFYFLTIGTETGVTSVKIVK